MKAKSKAKPKETRADKLKRLAAELKLTREQCAKSRKDLEVWSAKTAKAQSALEAAVFPIEVVVTLKVTSYYGSGEPTPENIKAHMKEHLEYIDCIDANVSTVTITD